MSHIQFRKEKLSIQNIGEKRFWVGLVAGVIFAISLSLLINFTRELLRALASISADLVIASPNKLLFFKYFFSTFATVLGLSLSISIWMRPFTHKRKSKHSYKLLTQSYLSINIWNVLIMFGRMAIVVAILLYASQGYENQLDWYAEYWFMFVLLIATIFFHSWMAVRLIYRIGHWVAVSGIACVLLSFVIAEISYVDHNKLNASYFQRFEEEFRYIENELTQANANFGIQYQASTISTLKLQYTESARKQVESVKAAFGQGHKVSLDSLILQKIILHNVKVGHDYYPFRSIERWRYATPYEILNQLAYYDLSDPAAEVLFALLDEIIQLACYSRISYAEWENATVFQHKRSMFVQNYMPPIIYEQLISTIDILKADEKYAQRVSALPEIAKFTGR
jgi:uncharacterized membrane protein (DUF485 family)